MKIPIFFCQSHFAPQHLDLAHCCAAESDCVLVEMLVITPSKENL